MHEAPLDAAIDTVPPGAWAVGVSGGADSVALLALLHRRSDLKLTVAHLDHETREGGSASDAQFVSEIARQWGLPIVVGQRHAIESIAADLPTNRSARFRALRLRFFRDIVAAHALQGVILAHHADDQAETVFLRLLRSASATGLAGMAPRSVIRGLTVLRPLLNVRSETLRGYLVENRVAWRDDESNVSDRYRRNRVRRVLAQHPILHEPLLKLAETAGRWRSWLRAATRTLPERFELTDVRALPDVIRREALRAWLIAHGAPASDVTPPVVARLVEMVDDAASPPRQHFPGGLLVRRRAGCVFIDP